MIPKILVINGALGGAHGNTAQALAELKLVFGARISWRQIDLVEETRDLGPFLREADAFVFATGTYWDSWGSPLQKFFEESTHFEGQSIWLGKPAAAIVTMHSVGGKGVLSRLQGVLSTLGLLIPPASGWVYSLANQTASPQSSHDDFWCMEDLPVIADNLWLAITANKNVSWKMWNVDRADPKRLWLEKS